MRMQHRESSIREGMSFLANAATGTVAFIPIPYMCTLMCILMMLSALHAADEDSETGLNRGNDTVAVTREMSSHVAQLLQKLESVTSTASSVSREDLRHVSDVLCGKLSEIQKGNLLP